MKKGKLKKMLIIISVIVMLIIAAVLIILPPSRGKVPQFRDENGNVLENSIAEKCFADINGTKLGMFIMAKDISKPVILFLGGGPGIPEFFLEQEYPTRLYDEYVVCYLEYRGCSLSYDKNQSLDDMTTEQYIADIAGVTNYLRGRFGQDKIYLIGHSFGTSVALRTVKKYPEYYHAYIAMAQGCDQLESEYEAYDYMLEQYRNAGNGKMVKTLEKYPIRDSYEIWEQYARSARDTAMHDLGVGTARDMKSVITGIFFPSLRCMVYTPAERINIWKGKGFLASSKVVYDSFHFNAFEEVPEIEIPIYFFAGKYDHTCCYDIQKKYFDAVEAPEKKFYTFENSAHSPLFEEPETALKILREEIIKS